MSAATLRSKFDGLSPQLVATLYPVDFDGAPEDGPEVQGAVTEGSFESTASWQSPFEQSGPANRAPALTALAQSGGLQQLMSALRSRMGSSAGQVTGSLEEAAGKLQGKSGMTKLNSRQIYTGSAPVKCTFTLFFKAYDDPQREVVDPVDQLFAWSMPKKLATGSTLINLLRSDNTASGFMNAMFPSDAPQQLGFRYQGRLLAPCVIESISRSMTNPVNRQGLMLECSVQISVSSITAMDQQDMRNHAKGMPIAVKVK